jgi:hypothetical protein
MTMKKNINMKTKITTLALCFLALFQSCEEDGLQVKLSGLDSSELMASESAVVLTKEMASVSVLALTWNMSALTISQPDMKIPGSVPVLAIEVSASSDFTTMTEITPQGTTYSFTGGALNTLAKNLGLAPDVSQPLFIRIRSSYGENTKPFYSNVAEVNVTPYTIDMSVGFILDSGHEDTGFTLWSPSGNGLYAGFTGVTAWYNWYLLEGDGTVWGNLGEDGNEFVLSRDQATHWNFWYPGTGGCYYATVNTGTKEWTATNIPALTVSGAVDAVMTFDRTAVKWFVSFTTTAANATVKVSCDNARLYNISTGTDEASSITRSLGFIAHSDSTLTIDWNSASAGDITIPEAGDYTMTFFLSDPKKWTFRVKEGLTVIEEPISKYLFLPGIDDGISGSWTFDNFLRLVSEDDSTFAGVVNVNSLWGYQMTLTSGDWDNVYKMGATEGTLAFKGASNIPAPSAGLYLIQADLKNLTYSHSAITSVSYAGLNDSWTMVPMDVTTVPGVYSSTLTISTVSQWGCKLYLNGNWDPWYGGGDGVLQYNGPGIVDDATIGTGTYDLVANLCDATYAFLGNQVYITGLNDVWDFTSVVLTKTSTGVYTGTAVISSGAPWGIQIHLDQSWNRYYGGSLSSMVFKGSNITDVQSLAAGTYTVTVDFLHNSCTFTTK